MHIDDKNFTCPHAACRRVLKLQFGAKGSLKNRYYVACFAVDHYPRGINFWHLFKHGEIPQRKQVPPAARPSSVLSVSSSASSLASSSSSAPSSDPSRSASTSSCSEKGCGRQRIHQHCARQMSTLPHAHLQTIISAAQDKAHALALRTPLPPSPTLSEEQEYCALRVHSKAAAAPQEPPHHANPATHPYYPYFPVPYTTTPPHPTPPSTSMSAQPQQSHAAVYSYPHYPQSTPQRRHETEFLPMASWNFDIILLSKIRVKVETGIHCGGLISSWTGTWECDNGARGCNSLLAKQSGHTVYTAAGSECRHIGPPKAGIDGGGGTGWLCC
ncbi:hypothetical protein DFH06DRAFT_1144790 [Mycena polygramma]|nr:hypothetical protein DFH06DRAFT_1144790 [Mycena polygramma]